MEFMQMIRHIWVYDTKQQMLQCVKDWQQSEHPRGEGGKFASKGLSQGWSPKGKAEDYSDGYFDHDWVNANIKQLMKNGIRSMQDAEEEWQKINMQKSNEDLHEIDEYDIQDAIRDNLRESWLDGWYRNADSGYKPKIMQTVLQNPQLRNAGLNVAWQNYKDYSKSDISFDDFLNTPMTMYRGTHGQGEVEDDVWSSFSFDPQIAKKFGSDVEQIQIKPIDTFGNFQTTGENQILVPRVMLKQIREKKKSN